MTFAPTESHLAVVGGLEVQELSSWRCRTSLLSHSASPTHSFTPLSSPTRLPPPTPMEAAWHRPGRAVTSLPPICEWAANEET